jgi:RHS repeat-associated protein
LLTSLSLLTIAQQTQPRGLYPAGTFQLSDVDVINATSGNLSMRFPLGSLPSGRGDVRAGFTLFYNNKLFDSYRNNGLNNGSGTYSGDLLMTSPQGGWQYGYQYKLQVYLRPNLVDYPACSIEATNIYRVVVTYPDGSDHEFCPWGYASALSDGYYNISPSGYQTNGCSGGHIANSMTYYSTDGTFTRLEVDSSIAYGDFSLLPWTMFLPDGTKITHLEPTSSGIAYQRIYDRNNNWVEIKNVTLNGHPAIKIVDELNREVVLEYGSGGSTITSPAPNNQTIVWQVVGAYVTPTSSYQVFGSDGYTYGYTFPGSAGVALIISPTQGGSLAHQFTYHTSDGGGELNEMILPVYGLAARTTYTFRHANTCQGCAPFTSDALLSYVSQKKKSYAEEYDGSTGPTVNEIWDYTKTSSGLQTQTDVQSPDGGVTKEYSFCSNGSPCGPANLQWRAGLVYKVENPDGSLTERLWQINSPRNPYEACYVNPYIKREFTSIKDGGVLSKTAIKDYSYDKNGNVTQVVEYDWVAYSSIPRDTDGRPTGIPAGASSQIKRVTVNNYHVATPDASDTTTPNLSVYNLTTAPKLRTAVKDMEVRSALASGTQSRTEYTYENATTIGNLTTQRIWDSTKGVIGTPPLNAGNSIAVTHQYQTWPSGATGKRTITTDANGNTTNYFYNDIGNGTSNLYVTQVETAANVAALKRTTTFKYDYNSGLVTETKDVDNNVWTLTTYDHYGRPTLVREAATTSAERQTATEYSDYDRRIIVKTDKDTAGDGKMISVQHFDQFGRLRLTRALESGVSGDAYDETKGIKVQTRYKFSSPYSYTLTSAPYRAATSSAASSQENGFTMGWTRTKSDQLGRVLEVETFGASLPQPWGSNSTGTGKVLSAYDAEFTTVTDQASKVRRSMVDGLGRLLRVDEPDSGGNLGGKTSPVQPTSYTYDALNNLTQVNQGAQTRTFNYSSLSRLTSATLPEHGTTANGTTTYAYDNNGNLTSKTDPRSVATTITYDSLNRPVAKSYTGGVSTPQVNYYYDNQTLPSGAPSYTRGFAKGRMVAVAYGGGSTGNYYGYDELGRANIKYQRINTTNYQISASYNKAGGMTAETYPSTRTVSYGYDNAGRLTSFSGTLGDGTSRTYASVTQYNAAEQRERESYGTGANGMTTPLYLKLHYNRRQQLVDLRLGSVNDEWDLDRGALTFYFGTNAMIYGNPFHDDTDNNGNLRRQWSYAPKPGGGTVTPQLDDYTYDSLNRLATFTESQINASGTLVTNVATQNFAYDRFGNRRVTSATGGVSSYNPTYDTTNNNNRIVGLGYDNAGNITYDPVTGGTMTFDAENRMVTASSGGTYVYDGEGKRVKRTVGGQEWWYVYGIGGELLAEYLSSASTTVKKEYGYRAGQLLVVWDADKNGDERLKWLVQDHLGSTRIEADKSGSLAAMKRHDYAPFGEEMVAGIRLSGGVGQYGYEPPQTNVRQKFTAYERDGETGLDFAQARYYGNVQGRFTSVDPYNIVMETQFSEDKKEAQKQFGGYLSNPQRWNRYSYCLNNSLLYTDPNGEDVTIYYRASRGIGAMLSDQDFGHILIYVRNDETGEAVYYDYYPGDNSTTVIGNVDQSRIDAHASFTIETTATQEQAILDAIKDFQKSPADFSLSNGNVCSTTCSDFLDKGGLGLGKKGTYLLPSSVWEKVFLKYAPDQLIKTTLPVEHGIKDTLINAPYAPGAAYGNDPRGQARKRDANATNANVKTTYQGGKVIKVEDFRTKQ